MVSSAANATHIMHAHVSHRFVRSAKVLMEWMEMDRKIFETALDKLLRKPK